ncbi:2-keto-3-deoxygluconate permease 2 [uncultured Alphaproteobacteria bacterium]|uniref:2-keto-3-deoxygluconate permease 2 n=1 Tax=uncultured Alphaproteobacteria bacterium TaxID=91750 RepID=A0A212JZ07_9PROT|nr:2-keto-3-deoxygluconate permease 2 [uncultured Alphaproteobacteria bacterium]
MRQVPIKDMIERVPGGMMVVPLLLGTIMNTIDQMHLPFVQAILAELGAPKTSAGYYEFLRIGGFTEQLFKTSALTLIALFLFCSGAQMNLRVGGRAMKKGVILTASKYLTGLSVGVLFGVMFDPMSGFLGLSTLAIIAAMTNGNGGMYAALTAQYGNRSDTAAVAVLSLNDGPFFTLMSLGLLGSRFPVIAFIAVLLPIALGMLLGNLDDKMRAFLKPGEMLPVPFFAFSLGAGMNLAVFFNPDVVAAGLLLGVMTTVLTGTVGALVFRYIARERSVIAPVAEATTAGNAVGTPAAIAAAATIAVSSGMMTAAEAQAYHDLVATATLQISISTISTALMGPFAVIMIDRWQRKRGVNGRIEEGEEDDVAASAETVLPN